MSGEAHAFVLSGGGANGAYEVGVMEALLSRRCRHCPEVDPAVFTGTSVGSYNAAAMVSLSAWGCLAAARQLRELWLDQIAEHDGRPNGVFRLRVDPRGSDLPRDLWNVLVRSWLPRGFDLALSDDPPARRLFRLADGADLFSTAPLERLISDTIAPVRLLQADRMLRIVACNWDTGEPVVFYNRLAPHESGEPSREKGDPSRDYRLEQLTEENVEKAILASTAIPAIFPWVELDADYYVDGGTVMNTPLNPAKEAGASVLHVIQLEAKLEKVPLGRSPSTIETLERLLAATPSRLVDSDIRYARLEKRLKKTEIVIHRYSPSRPIGGAIGLLDFRRNRLTDLIELGFRDAVEHDCEVNRCVRDE